METNHTPAGGGNVEANARLIAAAPDLLEACIEVESRLDEGNRPLTCHMPQERLEEIEEWLDEEILPKLRAVITKAKGCVPQWKS